jgi:type VI secretion system protein ImpL
MWRLLLFELVLVVVIVGIWFGAPLVGIKSVFWRIVIILALIIPPILLIIYNFLKARKASSGLEKEIKDQGKVQQETVRPDRRGEIQELNDTFSQAIVALKKSKLGGRRGTALYALPWYMIIGPPAVGKSTALLRSGLKFPFSTSDRGSIKGVGGTRNCDWWFADQAILLDTAGRYTSEDEDQEEWVAFLRMLKKYRKQRPLNGLLVAASVDDLLTTRPEELEEMATKIRARVDQVINELDLSLPVYILITKCDLFSGFVQFFGNMKKSMRSNVFGFTVPLTDAKTDIEQLFSSEFDLLSARLRERSLSRLASAKSALRGDVYKFPLEFAAARDRLTSFVSQLMMSNPYVEMPRLRGVYFCSGTQEGRPLESVMGMMSQALGLQGIESQGLAQKTTKKSYFLRNVFTKVIFPDQEIAGTTAKGQARRRRVGLAGLAAAFLISAGTVGVAAVTYSNNSSLISETVEVSKSSRITTPEDPRKVLDSLQALDRLRDRMNTLQLHAREGAPWSMSFGFYQGKSLKKPVEQIFLKRMRQAYVLQAGAELEATLVDISASADAGTAAVGAAKDFDLLKTYLMVTDAKRLDPKFAANILLGQWKKRLHPDVAQEKELLLRISKRYLELVKAGKTTWLERDNEVVRNVRHALRARDAEYLRIIGDAAKQLRPFTLRDALNNRVQSTIKAEHSVPGVYTRAGWTEFVRSRIAKQMVKRSGIEPWVLGEEGKRIGERLRDRYYEQYINAWKRFLKGLTVEPVSTAQESLQMLEKMTDHPSLYRTLITAIAHNTELPMMGTGGVKAKDLLRHSRGKIGSKLRKAQYLGLDKVAGKALKRKKNRVERTFWPLRELVFPPPGIDGRPQISSLDQYLSQLTNVRDALTKEVKGEGTGDTGVDKAVEEARRVTRGILATIPGELRRLVSSLLYTPLEVSSSTAKVAQANRASSTFSNELCAFYKERLAGKYPFAKSKREALLQDAVEFFAPKGTVWTYYEANFKHLIVRKGDRFQPLPDKKVSKQIISFFSRAWRITRALFPMGHETPRVRMQVRPQPAVLEEGASYQISEIIMEVGAKPRTYRNGPIEQWTFAWTGDGQRTRLLIRGAAGLREEISYQGDWSLLRLIDRGKIRKRGSWYRVEWAFKQGKIRIQIDFRPSRTHNPLFRPMRLNCR